MKTYRLVFLSMPVALMMVSCGQEASFTDTASGRQSLSAKGATGAEPDGSTAAAASIEAGSESVTTAGASDEIGTEDSSQGASSEDAVPAIGVPSKISASELATKCSSSEVIEYNQLVTFGKPVDTCAWGTDAAPNMGNLGKKDQRVSARYEQNVMLNVPDNALLCGMNMNFVSDGSAAQQMFYDDEIFMTFNDAILAASQSYETAFVKKDGLMMYDWTKVVGKKYAQGQFPQYCAGADKGQGECFIPPTETNGIMKVNFSDTLVQGIAASTGIKLADSDKPTAVNKSSFKFSFVTLGDNDSPIDCKHSKFEFKVTAKYVVFK
jgi:hypothetical protein